MPITRKEKEEIVRDLTTRIRSAKASVVFSFKTLTVADSVALRRALRRSGGRMRVVKKRLFRRLAGSVGMPEGLADAEGSIAVAWGDDVVAPAKASHAFVAAHREDARFLGGLLEGSVLSQEEVARLATLPAREELNATFLGTLVGSLRMFTGALSANLRRVPALLEARSEKGDAA